MCCHIKLITFPVQCRSQRNVWPNEPKECVASLGGTWTRLISANPIFFNLYDSRRRHAHITCSHIQCGIRQLGVSAFILSGGDKMLWNIIAASHTSNLNRINCALSTREQSDRNFKAFRSQAWKKLENKKTGWRYHAIKFPLSLHMSNLCASETRMEYEKCAIVFWFSISYSPHHSTCVCYCFYFIDLACSTLAGLLHRPPPQRSTTSVANKMCIRPICTRSY